MEKNFLKSSKTGRIILRDIIPLKREKDDKPAARQTEISRPIQKQKQKFVKSSSNGNLKFIILGVLLFAFSILTIGFFSSASVNLTLKQRFLEIDKIFGAGTEKKELGAEKFVLSRKLKNELPVSSIKKIDEKAKGTVIIYNAFSSDVQILSAQTRLESPHGKIYHLPKRVAVPGAKIINGKIEPQGVEVLVFADQTGEDYNIGPGRFTIPGLKGSAKYEGFYAVSNAGMTGGFSGMAKVVSEDDIRRLKDKIQKDLIQNLEKDFEQKVLSGFLAPTGGKQLSFGQESYFPKEGERADSLVMETEAKLTGFLISEKELEALLTKIYSENEKIANLKKLSLAAKNPDFEKGTFDLFIKGKIQFVSNINTEKLIKELAGKNHQNITAIFRKYPEIEKAEIIFRPSFLRIMPLNPKKIFFEEKHSL